jgi:CHAD domain-containing protein
MTLPAPLDPWIAAARGLAEAWPGVVSGEAAAVHRARVATRRLREALPVLDGDRRGVRRLRKDLRSLTCSLGPVRELDVTLGLVVRLLHDEPALDTALETIRVRLMERRLRRRVRLLRDIDHLDIAGILARVRALSAHGSSKAARNRQAPVDGPEIRRRMASRATSVRRAVDRAGALYAPEALHAVRVAVKKLRYSLELGRVARIVGAARAATRLRRYQDLLGEWHDWQILSAHASRVQGAMPVDDEHLADFTALAARVEDRCRALHAEFMTLRPNLTALVEEIALRANPVGAPTRHK